MRRGGKPVRRPLGVLTPCRGCPKIPDGVAPWPESAAEWDAACVAVYRHYKECQGVNWQVPDALDPVVRYHAGLIRQVEDAAEAVRGSARVEAVVTGLFAGLSKGKAGG